jgi:predicted sulfurtransferase
VVPSVGVWTQVVVDVRNSYEIRVGKFKRAVDPETDSFRQFPAWVDENLVQDGVPNTASSVEEGQTEKVSSKDKEDAIEPEQPRSPRRIAMYCTGGIRCEKATSLLVTQGFDEVRSYFISNHSNL